MLAAYKPKCPHWETHEGCKLGKKCKMSHDTPATAGTGHYMSYFQDESGATGLMPRIPLTEAFKALFQENGTVAGRQAGSVGPQRAYM